MSRKKDLREAAAETTHTAAERSTEILEQVLDAMGPLLNTASEKTEKTRQQVAPLAEQAKERLAPVTGSAVKNVAPLAATAAAGAQTAKKQLEPHLEAAAEKMQPAVDQARHKVQDDLVPQLVGLLHQAENHPAVSEASKRGMAAAAALRGEVEVPKKKKRSVGGTLAKVAAASALLAAAAVAVRQFLASGDDAWTAHQPSSAYRNEETVAQDPTPANPSGDATLDRAETEADRAHAASDVDSEPHPQEQMSAEGGPVNGAETVAEDLNVLNQYGPGSYVGDEPPSGYTVKGNERSMKYHTDESAGYERTIADVWFDSVEAAEKAGFTRAQR